MTALYMDENILATLEEFYVRDSQGRKRYKVTGTPMSLTKKLKIFDAQGRPMAVIERPVLSLFRDTYDIYVRGKKRAVIRERLFKLLPWNRHTIGIVNWDVNGSILDHDYTLVKGFKQIASIHRKWMSFGDCYEIRVKDGENELLVLATAVALDAITADHKIQKDLKR
ncbi:MAG: LURP-one-related family protein [Solobacterium sp.]|nr:LURP-one-related family protein [Solobacterium sp.]